MLPIPSTTVISDPSLASAHPNSRPMYPPPTIATLFGNESSSNAPVEDSMNSSSHGMNGKSMWLEPVAMMTFSASIFTPSPPVSTVQLLGPSKLAQPLIKSAPAALRSPSTPLFSLSTMESFHATSPFMSTSASPLTDRPMCPPSEECWRSASNLSAACMIALLGIQPLIRQVPPALSPSTTIVSRPSCAERIPATYPPGPAPMTKTWHLRVSVI